MVDKLRIAFVKFGGLSAGGTERWLQMMAASLPRDSFDVDYFYCDAAPYVGSDYKHADTDPHRQQYMQDHAVSLIKFRVSAKDITKATHDWVDTDFWKLFDASRYDFVQTGKAGPAEYPYYLMKLPVVEYVTLGAGVDASPNIACTIHLSQWQRARWCTLGGNAERSSVIPIPAESPASNDNLRSSLGIPSGALVAGFHQRNDDNIFSPIPLAAFAQLQATDRYFVVMGGGDRYKEQASRLGLTNVRFVSHSADAASISQFLNTLDIFAHGRKDGETFGTVLAEAMMHGKPCLSHHSAIANAQPETIGPAGLFAKDLKDYIKKLDCLFTDGTLRTQLASKGKTLAEEHFSLRSCVSDLSQLYQRLSGRTRSQSISLNNIPYGMSSLGFLVAGDIDNSKSVAHHVVTGRIPEEITLQAVRYLLPQIKTFVDVGAGSGLYSGVAAKDGASGIHVYMVEPDAQTFSMLEKTVWLNNWEGRVTVRSDLNLLQADIESIDFLRVDVGSGILDYLTRYQTRIQTDKPILVLKTDQLNSVSAPLSSMGYKRVSYSESTSLWLHTEKHKNGIQQLPAYLRLYRGKRWIGTKLVNGRQVLQRLKRLLVK